MIVINLFNIYQVVTLQDMLKKSTEGRNALKTKKKVKVEDLFSVG